MHKKWLWGVGLFVGAAAIWRPQLLQVLGTSLLDVALPPVWGGVLALLLMPAYRKLYTLLGGSSAARTGALLLCYTLLFGALTAVALLLVPQLARSTAILALHSGEYAANLWGPLETLLQKLQASGLPIALPSAGPQQAQLPRQLTEQLLTWAGSALRQLFPHLLGVTADVVKSLLQLVLGVFFSIYLLVDGPLLARDAATAAYRWLPQQTAKKLLDFCALCRQMISGWLTGQLLDCLILGACCSLGMAVLGFSFAAPVGLLTGLCSLVPMIGGTLGGVLSFILLLAVQPARAGWFLVFYLVLQQLEGRFLYPRIVGSRLGLPPVLVLFAILCGGELGGLLGIFLALPATAVAWAALQSALHTKENSRQKPAGR